ncbi:MAG TPA: proprotein convertase P-domain-containing protein, partial [Herpetosiphonaceae bacterium]
MAPKSSMFRLVTALIVLLAASAAPARPLKAQLPAEAAAPASSLAAAGMPRSAPQTPPASITAAPVIERFANSWHVSTIGMVYNPISQTVRYAHEGQTANPATLWDIGLAAPHTPAGSINLATRNAGWPQALNDRDGAEYDPVAGTYFITDFQGDLATRDDNLIEITHDGTILNAWELDGAGNDSSDASTLNQSIDIAIAPGATPRYFMTRAENTGTVYEIALTRAGLFTPATWSTVGSCALPGIGDNTGIDYDNEYGVLYHSSFTSEIIMVTDLACNPITSFTCDGGATANTGVTRIEGSTPQEFWVTDFTSNTTTRCGIPSLSLNAFASGGEDCANPITAAFPGDEVTFCYVVTNTADPRFTQAITYTSHSLQDERFGAILTNATYSLAPGASYTATLTTVMTQTVSHNATWTASGGPFIRAASAPVSLAVLNSPPSLCQTYASANVPLAINDNVAISSTLAITAQHALFDANVKVDLTHTWDADLVLSLRTPDGSEIMLANQRGGNGDNYAGTIFDSQAAVAITAGAPPFSGRFRPEGSLDGVNGDPGDGTWALIIQDTADGDQGTLHSWSLELCEPPAAELELAQTVGTAPGVCATTSQINVLAGTLVHYCYTITNTGNYTVTNHTLTDSRLGVLLDDAVYPLGPGASVNSVTLGLSATLRITAPTTSTATWSASLPGLIS